jgi:hypothetical protein
MSLGETAGDCTPEEKLEHQNGHASRCGPRVRPDGRGGQGHAVSSTGLQLVVRESIGGIEKIGQKAE